MSVAAAPAPADNTSQLEHRRSAAALTHSLILEGYGTDATEQVRISPNGYCRRVNVSSRAAMSLSPSSSSDPTRSPRFSLTPATLC